MKYTYCFSSRLRKLAGFTLIELMVTVAVVGILAAVAVPNYSAYVQRGKITDATSTLAQHKVTMERWYQDNRNYGSTATTCAATLPTSSSFDYSCDWGASGSNSQTFTLTATGKSSAGMSGFIFTIDQNNAKRTTKFAGTTVAASCWLLKKGDTC